MRIAMIGQKGLPATHGGVERHVEELSKRLVALGHEVIVYTRPNYTDPGLRSYEGIELRSLPTIGTKHLDAIVHCALAAWDSRKRGCDVVHFHAIGPALVAPLARKRGVSLVATIHAQDWRRQKWNAVAAAVLRAGEWMALRAVDSTICVSERLAEEYHEAGHTGVRYVPNGIALEQGDDTSVLREHSLQDGEYLLFAGRIVPEKGAHYLIDAWRAIGRPRTLVIAGDTSFSDAYVEELGSAAEEGVVFTGYEYGARLAALFRHAALFVLPSDLEGLPIVLLEALGYGVPVLASDIVPNLEVLGENGEYFKAGDTASLAAALEDTLTRLDSLVGDSRRLQQRALEQYDWDRVVGETVAVYREARSRHRAG